jgi:hypothetical protein
MIPNLTFIIAAYVIVRLIVLGFGQPKQHPFISIMASFALLIVMCCTFSTCMSGMPGAQAERALDQIGH